ncbi:hypothetical protein MAPG_05278 [Magnaporthiopsis poae ATCC 64411]|uniref:GS catalytic domain-containing protein n=1 Tax=Magnaporthiopsis poae (strain ATCC 64411 / 73-15) TaxID=644358 RepID=A0A0C4DYZ3_MAGP6|nr:hypothetical protein MAPG_05278 [Magnaporthiopsis poae ATCC 64411]
MGDTANKQPIILGTEKFNSFFQLHLNVRFIQLQCVDYTSTVRVRVVTIRHFQKLLENETHLKLGRRYLFLPDPGPRFVGRDPGRRTGRSYLIPDFNSIHLHPGHDDHAVVYCYFGDGPEDCKDATGTEPGHVAHVTFAGSVCPRRALQQALDEAEHHGLRFLVGFELEFTGRRVKKKQRDQDDMIPQVHQVSGLRTMEEFMMPLLCRITDALEAVGVPIQQFHCGWGNIPEELNTDSFPAMEEEDVQGGVADVRNYELVTGPLPPMEAVDALTTTKETARRLCRHNDVELTFNALPPHCNSLHANLSVQSIHDRQDHKSMQEHFLAGVLEHADALCAFACVRPESYRRLKPGLGCAGRFNKDVAVRQRRPGCWEMRLPDPAAQMYLYMAAVIIAGLSGVKSRTKLVLKDCPVDPAMLSEEERFSYGITKQLPSSPTEAFEALMRDRLLVENIGQELVETYVSVQSEFNRRLEYRGPIGTAERRKWLAART